MQVWIALAIWILRHEGRCCTRLDRKLIANDTPALCKTRKGRGTPTVWKRGIGFRFTLPDESWATRQVSDPTGVYGFAYDNMGRLIGTTTQYSFLPNQTFTNSYTYDAASNRTGFTAPDGSTNSYTYDNLNRLNSLTNSLTGQFGFSYDALSRRTQLTRPNGVNTNYSYDSLSRLLSVLHQSGTTTLDGDSYTYDLAGNRTSKTNYLNGITESYTYDPLYELTQVTQASSTTETDPKPKN